MPHDEAMQVRLIARRYAVADAIVFARIIVQVKQNSLSAFLRYHVLSEEQRETSRTTAE